MAKVLLLFNDLPFIQEEVATGGALRARSVGEGLKSRGHSVYYAIPERLKGYASANKINKNILFYERTDIDKVVEESKPDVIVQQWIANTEQLKKISEIPIVLDLPAPRFMEANYHNINMDYEVLGKIDSLALGDYFICQNLRQWYYYLPWLTLAGIETKRNMMGIIPSGASPTLPTHKSYPEEPLFIWGGIPWPWQDPLSALNATLEELDKKNFGMLKIIAGKFPYSYHRNLSYTDIDSLTNKSNRCLREPLNPYNKMLKVFTNSSVAIDLAKDSPERRLASPFRTIDYLSCGLPVIISNKMEMAKNIEEYGAGWVIDPNDMDGLKNIVRTILEKPKLTKEYGENAQRLTRDKYTWDKTIDALDRFCQNPIKRDKETPLLYKAIEAKETISSYGRASTLKSKGRIGEAKAIFAGILEDKNIPDWLSSAASFHLGEINLKEGNIAGAKGFFISCVELNPDHKKAAEHLKTL